ncbi:S-adenosyl-L-methionine-dependent methyltransferase [Phanerochaete sordida]|uniref:S-adenosyl-L-methionine-dependent methyltransferase n=1 Tax=Phanerochaete sordida TaxID=48140 RepID=A0A9P3G337_9APHY|nr:S-adenosyl-L-methionine-dependent methyltransferase [Phanerochaete sordida]
MDSNPQNALEELKALSSLIQDSIGTIETSLQAAGKEFPSPNTPITPESEAARMIPEVSQASALIVSAAYQLISSVRSPVLSALTVSTQYALTAALGVAAAANVAEALREAGPQGAHVKDIARASCIDPSKLARILRLLATNHIFVELSPDVFANNRISSCLDTGKSVQSILDSPETKHVGARGVASGVGHCSDEILKTAAYLQEAVLDPRIASSGEPNETAFNVAFKTELPVWEWLEQKGNEFRLARFGAFMAATKQATPPNAIVEGFDWQGLPEGAVVVDVGGGVGGHSLVLAQNFPHLRIVVQDREPVLKDAPPHWDSALPGALTSGRATLQAHDFFTPQPIKDASVFLLRVVIHDWSDKYALRILRPLREAATPNTRLIIVENFSAHACEDDTVKSIPGAERPAPPKPLLPNGGHASTISYQSDIQMMEAVNGQERTIKEFQNILQQSGWKMSSVHLQPRSYPMGKIIAVPA